MKEVGSCFSIALLLLFLSLNRFSCATEVNFSDFTLQNLFFPVRNVVFVFTFLLIFVFPTRLGTAAEVDISGFSFSSFDFGVRR